MANEYKFYTPQKSIEDLMLEVAESEVELERLLEQSINEDVSTQNPRLAADIADLERKIAASNRALAAANKLKNGDAHRQNIMKKQAEMSKRIVALKGEAKKVNDGSHIGVGEVAKKKDDAIAAKEKKKNRRKELAAERKAGRERAKQLSAERKKAKAEARAKK